MQSLRLTNVAAVLLFVGVVFSVFVMMRVAVWYGKLGPGPRPLFHIGPLEDDRSPLHPVWHSGITLRTERRSRVFVDRPKNLIVVLHGEGIIHGAVDEFSVEFPGRRWTWKDPQDLLVILDDQVNEYALVGGAADSLKKSAGAGVRVRVAEVLRGRIRDDESESAYQRLLEL